MKKARLFGEVVDLKARTGKIQDELRTSYDTIKDGKTSKKL